jgi:hypothetical protein
MDEHGSSGHAHEVYAPSLTGQGDRRQGLTPQVGIAAHAADLTDLIWFEDLHDVHLVLSAAGCSGRPGITLAGHEGICAPRE